MTSTATPVLAKDRIDILDSLRGIAILGILLMNIVEMAFIAGSDPFIRNEPGTINYTVWFGVSWLATGTQRALFSMLFGAGMLLFLDNKSKQGNELTPFDYYVRRQVWLIVFGLINIYIFLWEGDILFDYGCYGLLLFAFRWWSPKKLLVGAFVCFLLMLARENRDLYLDKRVIARGEQVEKIDTSVTKLTARQKEYLSALDELKEYSRTESKLKRIEKGNSRMRGTYPELYEFRTDQYLSNILNYTYFAIWDVLVFMLVGMAFYKNGLLLGKGKTSAYVVMAVLGLGIGLLLSYLNVKEGIDARYNKYQYLRNAWISYYEAGRVARTFGYFGVLMLMYKSGWFGWFFRLFRPVGQMAFTNYLTQSIFALVVFYGIGFGYFGKWQRYEAYLYVLAIWIIQIIWSHWWLKYFQYGPFEWIWRQLTYWKRLKIRRE